MLRRDFNMHLNSVENNIHPILSNILSDKKIEIKIIPSYSCNMNCNYCYNNNIDWDHYLFDKEKIFSTLELVFNHLPLNAIVEIIGGEPLSSENISKTIEIIDYLKKYDSDIKIVVQTGIPSIKRIMSIIPKIDGLSYSIDISSSPKIKNIENLKKITEECKLNSVLVQIQTVLNMADNPSKIYKFLKFCKSNGVGWIGIGYPQYSRYLKKDLDFQIKTYKEIIDNIDEFSGMRIGGSIIESVLDYSRGQTYSSSCMCGENSITIQPNGLITPSLHYSLSKNYTFNEYIHLKRLRQHILKTQNCKNCQFWGICQGGCMAHAHFLSGDVLHRDEEYCYVLTNLLKNLSL